MNVVSEARGVWPVLLGAVLGGLIGCGGGNGSGNADAGMDGGKSGAREGGQDSGPIDGVDGGDTGGGDAGGGDAGGGDAGGSGDAGDAGDAGDGGNPDAGDADAGDAGPAPFVALDCPEPPEFHVVFPPNGAAVDIDHITVRGQSGSLGSIATVKVAGITASSSDSFVTWQADVPVVPGTQTLEVVALDGAATELARTTVDVLGLPLQLPAVAALAAGAGTTLYAFANDASALFAIDTATDTRTVLTSSTKGTGDTLFLVQAMDYAPGRSSVVAGYYDTLYEVDTASGNRTKVPNDNASNEASLMGIEGLSVKGNTAYLVGTAKVAVGGSVGPALLSVALDTGLVSVISGLGTGSGPAFDTPKGLSLSTDGTTAYVADAGADSRVMAVNLANGARSVIATNMEAKGASLAGVLDVATVSDSELVVATSWSTLLVTIADGQRTSLADVAPWGSEAGVAVTANGYAAVSDESADTITLVPLAGGATKQIGHDAVGPVRVEQAPLALGVGGGRAFVGLGTQSDSRIVEMCASDPTRQHVLEGEASTLALVEYGAFAYDATRHALVVRGAALSSVDLSDGTTRELLATGADDGKLQVVGDRLFVAAPYTPALFEIDLPSGDLTELASAKVGSGVDLMFSNATVLDADRNRLLVTDYHAGLLAVDLTTLVRTQVVPNSGNGSIQFPRHIYFDTAVDRVRIHTDDGLSHAALVPETDTFTNVNLDDLSHRFGSLGQDAFDRDTRLLWGAPAGNRRQVYVIDIATGDGAIVLQ